MTEESTLEMKRSQAKAHRGVTYDNRVNKFTAQIVINGTRNYLGSFETAGQAGAAYTEARASHPIERVVRDSHGTAVKSFGDAFRDFLRTCQRDKFGNVLPGEIFTTSDGQRYRMSHVQHYTAKDDAHQSLDVWEAACRNCGQSFTTKTVTKARAMINLVRTCANHRGQPKPADAPEVWPDPPHWAAQAQRQENRAVAAKEKKAGPNTPSGNVNDRFWGMAPNAFWDRFEDWMGVKEKQYPGVDLGMLNHLFDAVCKEGFKLDAAYKEMDRRLAAGGDLT